MAGRKRVVILNGPPSVGKDVQAARMAKLLNEQGIKAEVMQVKEALYEATLEYYGLSDYYTEMFIDRVLKERRSVTFGGLSPREALQYVSEKIYKPRYGNDYFGKQSAQAVENSHAEVIIFSDGGFKEEVESISKVSDVFLIRVRKNGLDFTGDTRKYLYLDGIASMDYVITDGYIEEDTLGLLAVFTELSEGTTHV